MTARGALAGCFAPPLTERERTTAEREGWIFGVSIGWSGAFAFGMGRPVHIMVSFTLFELWTNLNNWAGSFTIASCSRNVNVFVV